MAQQHALTPFPGEINPSELVSATDCATSPPSPTARMTSSALQSCSAVSPLHFSAGNVQLYMGEGFETVSAPTIAGLR